MKATLVSIALALVCSGCMSIGGESYICTNADDKDGIVFGVSGEGVDVGGHLYHKVDPSQIEWMRKILGENANFDVKHKVPDASMNIGSYHLVGDKESTKLQILGSGIRVMAETPEGKILPESDWMWEKLRSKEWKSFTRYHGTIPHLEEYHFTHAQKLLKVTRDYNFPAKDIKISTRKLHLNSEGRIVTARLPNPSEDKIGRVFASFIGKRDEITYPTCKEEDGLKAALRRVLMPLRH